MTTWRQFIRLALWGLAAVEAGTAIAALLLPVAPENAALAGEVVWRCSIAALAALAMLAALRFFDGRANG